MGRERGVHLDHTTSPLFYPRGDAAFALASEPKAGMDGDPRGTLNGKYRPRFSQCPFLNKGANGGPAPCARCSSARCAVGPLGLGHEQTSGPRIARVRGGMAISI